ncbi:MAG: hypothetical protein ACC660_06590, partial [Acidimicrobiales bacterium]
MPLIRARLIEAAEWWVLVATVAVTPLVFSRWTFDVFNITEVTVLWIGMTIAVGLRLSRVMSGDWPRIPAIWPYVLAYVGVFALTTSTSRAPVVSLMGNYGRLGGMVTLVPAVLVAWLLSDEMSKRPHRRRQLLAAIALSSTVGAMYLIAQQLDLDTYTWLQFGGREPTHPP